MSGVPHKFDEDKQADFIAFYEQLKSTLAHDERLLFMHAVHPGQEHKRFKNSRNIFFCIIYSS
jgi:hypothetical protein